MVCVYVYSVYMCVHVFAVRSVNVIIFGCSCDPLCDYIFLWLCVCVCLQAKFLIRNPWLCMIYVGG